MTEHGQAGRAEPGVILVVEDDPGLQELIARVARSEGFAVLQAFDGATGLAWALTRPVDLVLLDIGMPSLDGRDVLQHLKQDPRSAHLPVLVCSGRRDEHSRRLALELGAVDFVEKPFDPRALIGKISHLVAKKRREHPGPPPPAPAPPSRPRARRALAPLPANVQAATVIGEKVSRTGQAADGAATPTPQKPLRVLLAEDTDDDVILLERQLRNGGFDVTFERVQDREAMRAALARQTFDLVVSDYSMPRFDALDALATLKESGLDLPFIVVSGTVDEASAVIALKAGAHDFVVKGKFARLLPAVERELREARLRAERRQMEEQLMLSDRMAAVGMLAAGVAHEINNPLAAVLGNLSIVCDTLEDPSATPHALREAGEAAAEARTAAQRVRDIVSDVRIFSRESEDSVAPVDLHRVLDSTIRMAWNDLRHRALLVKNYGPIRAVKGSEARLGQVFLNIIVNAAQAIAAGHAFENEIRVSTWMDGERVVVEVVDTGSGIAPEVLNRIFTPFVTTKPPGQGTGLGLSIARRIVTNLGGEITVDSEPGKGATFRVFLPGSEEAPVAVDLPRPIGTRSDAPRARILVVDDEVLVTNTIRRIVGTAHDLGIVFSGREALERIRSGERFDLILCDLLMPEMTGIDLYQALCALAPDQAGRMWFLSGGVFTSTAAAFLEAHADQVLPKPFDRDTLLHTLDAALASARRTVEV